MLTQTADPALTPFAPLEISLGALLQARGFEVRTYDQDDPPTPENTDLLLYVLAHESLMTAGAIHFDWRRLQGPIWHAMRRYWHELPTALISMGHPYYLNEAPRMPCVVNAYTAIQPVQEALVRKLLGEEPFVGTTRWMRSAAMWTPGSEANLPREANHHARHISSPCQRSAWGRAD